MPDSVRDEIEREGLALDHLLRPRPPIEAAHIFVTSAPTWRLVSPALRPLLAPAGFIWVSWPKKASKVPTDINEDVIREVVLPAPIWSTSRSVPSMPPGRA